MRGTGWRALASAGGLVVGTGLWLPIVGKTVAGRYIEGPPSGHTGGFGEPSCHECHFDHDLNDTAGALQLDGIPGQYAPGQTYTLTVALSRPEMSRAGFQLAARVAAGTTRGQGLGRLRPTDDRVQLLFDDAAGDTVYAQHTEEGTSLTSPTEASWTVEWTAPVQPAAVVFHVAANAANDDASEFGDHIYTTQRLVQAER